MTQLYKIIAIYLLLVNLIAFALYGIDKRKGRGKEGRGAARLCREGKGGGTDCGKTVAGEFWMCSQPDGEKRIRIRIAGRPCGQEFSAHLWLAVPHLVDRQYPFLDFVPYVVRIGAKQLLCPQYGLDSAGGLGGGALVEQARVRGGHCSL